MSANLTRKNVPLSKDELQAVVKMAAAQCRHPRDQARFLLREALTRSGFLPSPLLPYTNAVSKIPCNRCQGAVVEFTIPNDIWNKVMRPDGHEHDGEYICIDCWYDALRAHLELQEE